MYKIRIHGRGGQGAKTAARILGYAAFLSGKEVQDFAVYGAERRGAPVTSFVRISPTKIYERGYIHDPDCVIILDDSLLQMPELKPFDGLKEDNLILINSKDKIPDAITVDTTQIALDILKRPVFNTTMLGAFAAASPLLSFRDITVGLEKVLKEKNRKLVNSNIIAIKECYDKTCELLKSEGRKSY